MEGYIEGCLSSRAGRDCVYDLGLGMRYELCGR